MIFPLLLAGHLPGDYVVQTDHMAMHKTTSWRANQAHVATYHLAFVPVAFLWHDRWALLALAVSWISHSILDRRWPVRRLMEVIRSRGFATTPYGMGAVDQSLHIAILAFLSMMGPG